MTANILFTSAGGMHAQRLFSSIKKNTQFKNLEIHAVNNKITKFLSKNKFHNSFTKVSKPNKKKYIIEIKNISKKKNIDIILPGSDEESLILSAHKKQFKSFISSPGKKNLPYMKNKYLIMKKLKSKSLLDINFEKVNTMNALVKKINLIKNKNLDLVIKPVFSRGGRNILIINHYQKKNKKFYNNKNELHVSKFYFFNNMKKILGLFQQHMPVLLMEKLYEPYLDADFLCWKGKLIKYSLKKRIGAQAKNGSVILKHNSDVEFLLTKISKVFNLSGIYDCDLMFNKKKKATILELNPRISGSLYASIKNGFNVIDDLFFLIMGKNNKIKKYINKKEKKILASKNLI